MYQETQTFARCGFTDIPGLEPVLVVMKVRC